MGLVYFLCKNKLRKDWFLVENENKGSGRFTRGRPKTQVATSEKEYQKELQSRFDYFLEMYPEVNNEKKTNLRSQLFLMVKWWLDEETVKILMEHCVQLQDMDFFRFLLLLVNDIDFIKNTFMGKDFYYEEALDISLLRVIEEKYPVAKEIERLSQERKRLKEEYCIQIEFQFRSGSL